MAAKRNLGKVFAVATNTEEHTCRNANMDLYVFLLESFKHYKKVLSKHSREKTSN